MTSKKKQQTQLLCNRFQWFWKNTSHPPIEIVSLFDVTDCPVFSGPFGHVHKALYPGLFGIAWNIPCHMSRSLTDHCHIPSICSQHQLPASVQRPSSWDQWQQYPARDTCLKPDVDSFCRQLNIHLAGSFKSESCSFIPICSHIIHMILIQSYIP